MEERILELEAMLTDAADYVRSCIGSSYCETDDFDWETLHSFEDVLGLPRTDKRGFYY